MLSAVGSLTSAVDAVADSVSPTTGVAATGSVGATDAAVAGVVGAAGACIPKLLCGRSLTNSVNASKAGGRAVLDEAPLNRRFKVKQRFRV